MRIADRSPDWIWPKWTTPVTPTTSSIPSQWFGTENWWSRSKPHGLAPEPQLFRLFVCCFVFFSVHTLRNYTSKERKWKDYGTHLRILRMMIPSTGGRSTNLPSTSKRISRCMSLHIFRPIIFLSPIFTYTLLL